MADNFKIVVTAKLDTQASLANIQKDLNKLKGLKVDVVATLGIDTSGITKGAGKAGEQLQKQAQETAKKVEKIYTKSLRFNPKIERQSYGDLQDYVNQIKAKTGELARISLHTNGKNGLQSATLEYTDQQGKSIRETMAQVELFNKKGEVTKRVWKTVGVDFVDNFAKGKKAIQDTETALRRMETVVKGINTKVNSPVSTFSDAQKGILNAKEQSIQQLINSFRGKAMTTGDRGKIQNELAEYKSMRLEMEQINKVQKQQTASIENSNKALDKLRQKAKEVRSAFSGTNGIKDEQNLNRLKGVYVNIINEIHRLKMAQQTASSGELESIDKRIAKLRQLNTEYKNAEKTVGGTRGLDWKSLPNVAGTMINAGGNIQAQVKQLTDARQALNQSLLQGYRLNSVSGVQQTQDYLKVTQQLQRGNQFVDITAYVNRATNAIHTYQTGARNAMVDTLTWEKALVTAIKRMAQWTVSGTLIFGSMRAIKDAITYVIQMDTALTSLTKVVDLTAEQMAEMTQASIQMGKALGQSSVEIMKGMAEFGRYFKDTDDIQEMTKVATMASNVTTLSVADASKYLTSAMITYKKDASEAMGILDSWNEIQNNFRTSAEDLAHAISVVGASARQSGISMQELQGQVTAIVSSTGLTGNEVGTAIKSMISRVFRIGEEGVMDAGKAEEQLNKIGVAVRKTDGTFRAYTEILADTKKQWDGLTNTQRQAVAQQVAGKIYA